MQLITSAQRQRLLENGRAKRTALDQKTGAIDFEPVVKLFTPDGSATWLLTELDSIGGHLAFGLCDLGLGEPELGYMSLHELAAARGPLGLPPRARSPLRSYAHDRGLRRARPRASAHRHLT
jgi:hypothetical protein